MVMNRSCTFCDTFSRIVVLDFENRQALCYWCSEALVSGWTSWTVPQSQPVEVFVNDMTHATQLGKPGKIEVLAYA